MPNSTDSFKYLTPEAWLDGAYNAINNEQWERATAYATVGLFNLAINGMKRVRDDG